MREFSRDKKYLYTNPKNLKDGNIVIPLYDFVQSGIKDVIDCKTAHSKNPIFNIRTSTTYFARCLREVLILNG
jgi:hypothetical protein